MVLYKKANDRPDHGSCNPITATTSAREKHGPKLPDLYILQWRCQPISAPAPAPIRAPAAAVFPRLQPFAPEPLHLHYILALCGYRFHRYASRRPRFKRCQ
jgi:hypothetical protein